MAGRHTFFLLTCYFIGTSSQCNVRIVCVTSRAEAGNEVKLIPKLVDPGTVSKFRPAIPTHLNNQLSQKHYVCQEPACQSHPCFNGGTCTEEPAGYSCSCLGGYIGIHCEQHVCLSQPCFNGGTCLEEPEGYSCSCRGGLIGMHCEQLVPVCPAGWVYARTKCFLVEKSLSQVRWETASAFCNGLDAVTKGNGETIEPSLLFIEDMGEYFWLQPHVMAESVWMNCNFADRWICYTDRAGTTSDYQNWATGQRFSKDPDGSCAMLAPWGEFYDSGCDNPHATVCQVNIMRKI